MKYRARLQGPPANGDVPLEVAQGSPLFRVTLDGETFAGHAVAWRPGIWTLVFEDGRQVEVSLEPAADGALRARFGNALVLFELQDELTALALATAGRGKSKKGDVVAAAMPGRVLRVAVASGEAVTSGQSLLVLEAMKMENDVKAPRDGVVEAVAVAAGQAVNAGEVLVRFRREA